LAINDLPGIIVFVPRSRLRKRHLAIPIPLLVEHDESIP
jgi:hypothetical protein